MCFFRHRAILLYTRCEKVWRDAVRCALQRAVWEREGNLHDVVARHRVRKAACLSDKTGGDTKKSAKLENNERRNARRTASARGTLPSFIFLDYARVESFRSSGFIMHWENTPFSHNSTYLGRRVVWKCSFSACIRKWTGFEWKCEWRVTFEGKADANARKNWWQYSGRREAKEANENGKSHFEFNCIKSANANWIRIGGSGGGTTPPLWPFSPTPRTSSICI